jgi:hypothetical protein
LKHSNPYIATRALWVLPYLGDEGIKLTKQYFLNGGQYALPALKSLSRYERDTFTETLTTYKHWGKADIVAAICGELYATNYERKVDFLVQAAAAWDGKDLFYLDALYRGAGHERERLWNDIKLRLKPGESHQWSANFSKLTWKFYPIAALPELELRVRSKFSRYFKQVRGFGYDGLHVGYKSYRSDNPFTGYRK